MGLDMYAYVANRAGEQDEFYEVEGRYIDGEWVVAGKTKPRELAYWRKHPNLHGWMEHLWVRKRNAEGNPVVELANELAGDFNGVELELTWEDLDELERAVTNKQLPATSGFFFGNDADDHYRENDLQFIREAKAEIFVGLKVFYNSSW